MATPDPSASAPAISALISVAGIATGLPADLVMPGFAGALWALRQAPQGGLTWRVIQVLVGTLVGAWFTPAALYLASSIAPESAHIPHEVLRYPLAFVLGWRGLVIVLRWSGDVLERRS